MACRLRLGSPLDGDTLCPVLERRAEVPASSRLAEASSLWPLRVTCGTIATSGIRTGRDPAILVSGARDWTWVTVAYCTGDQHMGNRVARYDDGNGGVRLAQCNDS